MMGRMTDAVRHLLIINVLLFVGSQLNVNGLGEQLYTWLSLFFVENPNFQYWQVVSHMFMHGSVMHILFNMYALWAFGTPLEQQWGRNKFLFFYFSAGIGAALLHTGVNYYYFLQGAQPLMDAGIDMATIVETFANGGGNVPDNWLAITSERSLYDAWRSFNIPAVGASGAIYGVLVAFAFMYSEARLMLIFLPIPIKAKYFVPAIIALDLYFGITNSNTGVAHFAHIGGALIGFIMMWYWKRNQFNKNRWD